MTRFLQRHLGFFQLILVVGIVGFAVLLSVSLRPEKSDRAPAARSTDLVVSTVLPVAEPYQPSIRLNGVVQSRTVTRVIPQVSGRVIDVSPAFRPGLSVAKGDVLIVIDPADYELAVERTLAEIESARSDLARLEAEAAAEREVWQGKFPGRPIPDLIARVPQIAATKARIHSGQAARRAAELALARTTIRAPFDARVLETQLDVGQVVGTTAQVGVIFSIDSLEIAVAVSAEERRLIGPLSDQPAAIFLPDGTGESIGGRLVRAAAALDERTRLGTLYVTTDNPGLLTVGDFVTVNIVGKDTPDSYRLPAAALTSRDRLWVVENGRLAGRTVEVVGREDDMAVVSVFDAADGVVTVPPSNGRDGLAVSLRDRVAGNNVAGVAGGGSFSN